jgi:hypothetical protein
MFCSHIEEFVGKFPSKVYAVQEYSRDFCFPTVSSMNNVRMHKCLQTGKQGKTSATGDFPFKKGLEKKSSKLNFLIQILC